MPAFGFSVGDFVAVASLIWRLTQALDEASDDSKLFREIQLELSAFRDVIVQFQNAMATGAAPSKEQVDRTRTVLSHIERVVKQLMQHTEKFKGAGPADKDGTKVITGWRKKVQWSFFGKKQIQQFREGLRSYAAVLMLIMQSLNSYARSSAADGNRDAEP
ncbi:hypothetical protein BDW74DRAFT_143569 [Aspergillus multicolor]|uniref:uncharacterized protein n=1 Tax=Aspergillus multicolor TaxID=41759 RepID=UPI003CCDD891